MLALWSRARPRDYFDVAVPLEHYGRGELLELAASRDAGFTPAALVDALRAIDRLTPGDWEEDGVDVADGGRVRQLFGDWRSQLTDPP